VQKLDYKALIPGNWAFNYLKYSVCNVLKWIKEEWLRTFINVSQRAREDYEGPDYVGWKMLRMIYEI
jgi:hypothetical protein